MGSSPSIQACFWIRLIHAVLRDKTCDTLVRTVAHFDGIALIIARYDVYRSFIIHILRFDSLAQPAGERSQCPLLLQVGQLVVGLTIRIDRDRGVAWSCYQLMLASCEQERRANH